MKNIFKRTLALCLIAFAMVGVFAISASAANFASSSTMVMVDPNTKKTASTFYLYGRADYICLKMNNDRSDQGADRPTFELYSDSAYKNKIAYYQSSDPNEKTAYITVSLDLSNVKSGTYYAKTYIKKDDYSGFSVDESTIKTYKIVIKKGGTTMTDMNTVMYGYENTEKGPKIYWFGVPDATGYYVYRRNPDTKKYEKIKTVKDNGKKLVSYTDASREGVNSTDYYKVVAYKGSKKTPSSLKSLKATVLKTPTITIEPKGNESIKISWSKVKSGANYTVLMRTKSSDWKEIFSTKSNYVIHDFSSKVKSDTVYYFTVIAEVNGIYSGYNVNGKAFRFLKTPSMNPCTYPEEGGATVNWNLVTGADQYAIYKMFDGKWQEIALVDGEQTSYTDVAADVINGETYTVCSMANGAYKFYSSVGQQAVKFEKMILNDVVEKDGKLQISWTNPVEGQNCSYEVNYKTNYGSQKYYVVTTTGNSCEFTPSNQLITYEFNVFAKKSNYVTGPENDVGVFYTHYPEMHKPTVLATQKGAVISWRAMSGADGYAVYRKTADSEYELIGETNATKYTDADVENDILYTYKVAYKHNGQIITDRVSSEISATFIDEEVKFVDELYKASSSNYLIKIDNYVEDEATYRLYRKAEDNWETVSGSLFFISGGKISIPVTEGKHEYAISKAYADGRFVRLPENGFVIDFDGAVNDVEIMADKNVVSFSWNPEALDADKVLIYKNEELFSTVDKAEGGFTDNSAKPNCYNNYAVYTQSGNFVSCERVRKEHVYLESPDFTVSSANDKVNIYWGEIEADCYVVVYRAKGSSTDFEEIEQCYSSRNGTDDYHVGSGSTYRYAVALRDSNDNTTSYKDNIKTLKYLDCPVITSAKSYKDGVRVVWREVKKAEGYIVSYKEDGEWVELANLSGDRRTFVDKTNLVSGKKRTYKVQAYSGSWTSLADYENTYYLERPVITSVSSTTKQIKINFNKVEGAQRYTVYYKLLGGDEWQVLGSTTGSSYTQKTQRPGVKFTYSVAAVMEKSGKKYASYKSASKNGQNLATPLLDSISSTKSGIKLSWGITPYATGYNVYRKNSDGEFEKIAYVKGNESVSYVDKTAKKGKTYTYTVRAKYSDCVSGCNKTGLTCKDKY